MIEHQNGGAFFLRLATSSEDAFERTIRFYTRFLGFAILKLGQESLENDKNADDTRRCWLRFCSSKGPLAELTLLISLRGSNSTDDVKHGDTGAKLICAVDSIQVNKHQLFPFILNYRIRVNCFNVKTILFHPHPLTFLRVMILSVRWFKLCALRWLLTRPLQRPFHPFLLLLPYHPFPRRLNLPHAFLV